MAFLVQFVALDNYKFFTLVPITIEMEQILDFNTELNIATFDKVCQTFFRGGPEVSLVQLATPCQESPRAISRPPSILGAS
jgi:hypothetical protein